MSPSLTEVLKELNGKALADLEDPATKAQIKKGQQVPGFAWLKDDGTTACGNWLYSGSYTEAGNQTARRDPSDPSNMGVHPGLGMVVAGESARAVQPGFVRCGRQALGCVAEAGLVE